MQKGCASRFLHGPGTDQDKVGEIEKALEAKTELQVEIQFYRKNGNELALATIHLQFNLDIVISPKVSYG